VIDHTATRFEDVVDPVHLVFDTTGGERLERSPAVLRPGGSLVSIAEEPPPRASGEGIKTAHFVVKPDRGQLAELARLADAGELRPSIDKTFPLADARTAFERSLGKNRRGKIVLRVVDES
jgi:NADPH:quinone reductase-like Zn-dependent oxidoreductase